MTVQNSLAESGFAVSPYLLDIGTDSATIAFHLKKALPATVRVFHGETAKEYFSDADTSHFIRITDLEPGTAYNYEVICGQGAIRTPESDPGYQIRTACKPGESFIFAVYGDTRPGDTGSQRHHRNVIQEVVFHEPSFALILGDMVDNGDITENWEAFFDVESELLRGTAVYPVMGDNDRGEGKGGCETYFPKLRKGYYHFEWAGVQFFAMNAWDTRGTQPKETYSSESPQIRWLISELSGQNVRDAPFRVVFLHDPVYISRGRSSELLRRIWAPIFEKYNVDVVFASWHLYERSHNKGVTYIISGGAGAELLWMNPDPSYRSHAEARQHHFCRVDIYSDTMNIRAIGTDGTVLDQITLTPKSNRSDESGGISRMAKRLQKVIRINNRTDLPEVPLYLFSYDCGYCRRLLRRELPLLAEKYQVRLKVLYFDFAVKGVYDLFLNAGAEFGRQDSDVPAIFMGRSVLGGESEISTGLPAEISKFLKNPNHYQEESVTPFEEVVDTKQLSEDAFQSLTLSLVIGAGLLDGINPCAFTTIIFLISYLSLFGATRGQVAYTGAMFTVAVFLTYLAIGLVFYHFIKTLLTSQALFTTIHLLLLVIVVILAGLSFYDFIRCLKGDASDVTLQLPDFLKTRIQERIRNFAGNKIAMTAAPFILGVVIAGMELSCTGQVYLPIVTMISDPRHRVSAISYLFIYNAAFILPLVIVFLLAIFGVTSGKAGRGAMYVAGVKLAHTVFFVLMGFVLLYNLGWI